MDIRELLIKNSPELERYTKTDQYKLSRTMMKIRAQLSLKPMEIAQKLNITFEDYIKYESGSINISTQSYNDIVKKMIQFLNEHRDEQLKTQITKDLNVEMEYNADELKHVATIDKICFNNLTITSSNDLYSTNLSLGEVA